MRSLCVKQQHLIQELVLQKCLKSSTGSWQLQGTTHVNLPNWVLMLSIEYETKPRVGVLEIAAFTSRSNNSHKSECQALSVAKPWQAQAFSMKTSPFYSPCSCKCEFCVPPHRHLGTHPHSSVSIQVQHILSMHTWSFHTALLCSESRHTLHHVSRVAAWLSCHPSWFTIPLLLLSTAKRHL